MPTIDTLLVDRAPGETRVAALAGEQVVEVHYHHPGEPAANAIYLGRTGKRLPDSSAVFVDIGHELPAFLNCGFKPPVEGSVIYVRIVQPPRGRKGAKVAVVEEIEEASPRQSIGLVKPAPHPVQWCMEYYGDKVEQILVYPNDIDGLIKEQVSTTTVVDTWLGDGDLFDIYGVNEAIERALDSVIVLDGGARLIIEQTAALTAVDIDAGPMKAADANLMALEELAIQLRIRAIAGPVIVDLIPSRNRTAAIAQMKQLIADDPTPTRVSGLTPEGRLEINRRRLRPTLADLLLRPHGSRQPAPEAVAFEAVRRCVRAGLLAKSTRVVLAVHADVAVLFQGRLRSALDDARLALKIEIEICMASECPLGYIDVQT